MPSRRTLLAACSGISIWLAGCATSDSESPSSIETESTSGTDVPTGPYWYTHPNSSGNRIVGGTADLRDTVPVRIEVDSPPRWLVAHPAPKGSYWTAVTDDDQAVRWHVTGEEVIDEVLLGPQTSESPPVVASNAGEHRLLNEPSIKSPRSGQLVVPKTDRSTHPRRVFV